MKSEEEGPYKVEAVLGKEEDGWRARGPGINSYSGSLATAQYEAGRFNAAHRSGYEAGLRRAAGVCEQCGAMATVRGSPELGNVMREVMNAILSLIPTQAEGKANEPG